MEISYLIPKVLRRIFNPPAIAKSDLDRTVRVDIGSLIVNSTMGKYSYVGEHTSIISTDVGKYTCISNFCAIGGGNHPISWASMSPVFNSSKGILKKKLYRNQYEPFKRTFIGNDVWIGSHCLIKSGITIANGAVIGMGAVVTEDVGPYEVWAGVPAKLIKKRFDEKTIQALTHICWWDKSDEEIKRLGEFVPDIDVFVEEAL